MSKKKSKQASASKVLSSTLMQMANWLRYKEGWLPDAATRQAWLCQHALERLDEGGFRSFNAARLDDYLPVTQKEDFNNVPQNFRSSEHRAEYIRAMSSRDGSQQS